AWLAGVDIDWDGFHAHERRQRVPLPTYRFERQRYCLDPSRPDRAAAEMASRKSARQEILSIKGDGLKPTATQQPEPLAAAALNESLGELLASPAEAFGDETVDAAEMSLALERVMELQLHILAKQLELLHNSDNCLDAADE